MASNFLTVITIALILDYMRLFNEILSKLGLQIPSHTSSTQEFLILMLMKSNLTAR